MFSNSHRASGLFTIYFLSRVATADRRLRNFWHFVINKAFFGKFFRLRLYIYGYWLYMGVYVSTLLNLGVETSRDPQYKIRINTK